MKLLYTVLLNPNIDIFSLPSMCQIMQEALYPCLLFPVRGEGTEEVLKVHGAEVGGLLPLSPGFWWAPLIFTGNVVNIQTGHWVGKQSGLGAGLDSFYEYLLKSYILFGEKEDLEMFNAAYQSIQNYLRRGYVSSPPVSLFRWTSRMCLEVFNSRALVSGLILLPPTC